MAEIPDRTPEITGSDRGCDTKLCFRGSLRRLPENGMRLCSAVPSRRIASSFRARVEPAGDGTHDFFQLRQRGGVKEVCPRRVAADHDSGDLGGLENRFQELPARGLVWIGEE